MNPNVTKLYVAILGNEVVCFESNLRDFVNLTNKVEPKTRNYDWFYRMFKKQSHFDFVVGDKTYYFQQLI